MYLAYFGNGIFVGKECRGVLDKGILNDRVHSGKGFFFVLFCFFFCFVFDLQTNFHF